METSPLICRVTFFSNDFNNILHTIGSSVTGFFAFEASVKNIGSTPSFQMTLTISYIP